MCVMFILCTCTNNKLVTRYSGILFISVLLGKLTDGIIAYVHVKVVAPTCQWTHSPVIKIIYEPCAFTLTCTDTNNHLGTQVD